MNSWAASAAYDCHFLCICVVGDKSAVSLAREMGKESQMSHCVNGFIDNRAGMPQYGQLGCRGFIVLDAQHKVVSRATSAFMEVRDMAFKHVEALLDAVCAGKPSPAVCPGEFVQLMQAPSDKPQLVGAEALCIGIKEDLLNLVLVQGSWRGKQIQVPLSAVRKLTEDDERDEEEEAGGCGAGGCGPGGCGPGSGDKANCDPASSGAAGGCNGSSCDSQATGRLVDMSVVNSSLQLVSVKVPSMDHEHDECAALLRRLAVEQSPPALEAAIRCLVHHFEHEEALFEEFGFGGADERFSAKKSHIEEHRRITGRMQRQLAQGAPGGRVSADFIEEVLKDFHEHTSRYDVQYAEILSSKGAK